MGKEEKNKVEIGHNEPKEKEPNTITIKKAIFSIFSSLFAIIFVLGLSSYLTNLDNPDSYFSKSIQNDISLAINNGGDLATVKHIFNSRKIEKKGILEIFFGTKKPVYPENTSLEDVLADLKVNYYLNNKKNKYYLNKLENIISIHNQINPFDKLESNQRFSFENIRQKLDTNYVIVQEDLNRVVDELNNKNLLVNKYLDQSTTSYWISIIALVLTVILSVIQIWQNWQNSNISKTVTYLEVKESEKDESSQKS